RHYDALLHAKQDIIRVQDALHANLSGDLVSEELHICLDQLSEITGGQITPNEVLANIFKHFCIGK
ncbi:tRNA uridine-5-carboxymethylaminomethyl(34) synthesis GTPase MnmE, partial [Prevotella buccae]|nr:tRNA uridine-5-carboxymethylaminomethyl(34) synthesis GTPase MnmE [Segatella buccae]